MRVRARVGESERAWDESERVSGVRESWVREREWGENENERVG